MPALRPLTSDEEAELSELTQEALDCLDGVGGFSAEAAGLEAVLTVMAGVVDEVRGGRALGPPFDEADDAAYALGSLWGARVSADSGWAWGWLTLDDGFEGYVLVPEDGAYAVWPHHFLYGLLSEAETENTVRVLAECIVAGELPPAEPGALVLLG